MSRDRFNFRIVVNKGFRKRRANDEGFEFEVETTSTAAVAMDADDAAMMMIDVAIKIDRIHFHHYDE